MMNYKQLLTYWSSIAYNHEQIKSFGFGDITQCTNDLATKQEPQYTRLYIVPQNVEFNENHIHYNFSVIVMDKIEDDLSNQPEVMSDTLAIMMDLWTVFWQSYTYESGDFSNIIVGDWGPEVHPFLERFQTNLGGWTMNIKMSAPFDYNSCVIPTKNIFDFPQDQSFSSYLQIIKDWKEFADEHEQVRSWGFGDIHQLTNNVLTEKEPLYPRLYFVPETTRFNTNHLHITWRMIICDKVEDDLSNQQDVLSDCLEIAKDFYAKAYLSDYDLEWNANLEPWLEETETILAGWTLTINVQQKFDYNRCVLPIRSFADGITWEELAKMWKEVNQQWDSVKKTN
jgi:hypothetical protein